MVLDRESKPGALDQQPGAIPTGLLSRRHYYYYYYCCCWLCLRQMGATEKIVARRYQAVRQYISTDNIVETMLQGEDTQNPTWNFVGLFTKQIIRVKNLDLDNTIWKNKKSDVSLRAPEQYCEQYKNNTAQPEVLYQTVPGESARRGK